MSSILVDTGVWHAIFDPRDRPDDRVAIEKLVSRIDAMSVIVPWPVVYETLRTKFVRNRLALGHFERRLKSPKVVLVDDAPYRDDAFSLSLDSSLRGHRPLSLVDCVVRLILDDVNTKIRYCYPRFKTTANRPVL